MTDAKVRYRQQTKDALYECAKWLEDNADVLLDEFTNDKMGCKSWSLSFTFDPDRFPEVVVDTDCKMVDVIKGTYSF